MGLADSEAYWEVNLSPRGDWNIYHLQGYRQGLQAEMAIKTLPLVVNAAPLGSPQPGFELQAVLNGATLFAVDQPIHLGITAVIQDQEGALSYWALRHCGSEPDFHLRESFALKL
ncbi:MAG: hypothetical protein HC934_09605 [Acaryochloridaceae cyanobacterium SU_2_1]|nr:hypothetical protein [Acaryochloridaceae cyanobacterium SU_2_1]